TDQDQAVGTDAEMAIADRPRQPREVGRRLLGERVDVDVVVANAMHLGESHAFRGYHGAAAACNQHAGSPLSRRRIAPTVDRIDLRSCFIANDSLLRCLILGMPAPTAYDLRFRFLGIPVRVHPLFWLTTALLAGQDAPTGSIMIWIGCVFVSILVH